MISAATATPQTMQPKRSTATGWLPIAMTVRHIPRRSAPTSPMPFGLYDVLGNVKVWAADCWNDSLDKVDINGAPTQSGDCGQACRARSAWDIP